MHEEYKTMGMMVGRVLDINGPRLMYTRKFPNGRVATHQAYVGMLIHVNDHLKTSPNTVATLEFNIGGEAAIYQDTEVVVVGQRDIEMVGNRLLIMARKIGAKLDKQNTQLQIQINSGSGIEG